MHNLFSSSILNLIFFRNVVIMTSNNNVLTSELKNQSERVFSSESLWIQTGAKCRIDLDEVLIFIFSSLMAYL